MFHYFKKEKSNKREEVERFLFWNNVRFLFPLSPEAHSPVFFAFLPFPENFFIFSISSIVKHTWHIYVAMGKLNKKILREINREDGKPTMILFNLSANLLLIERIFSSFICACWI